MTTLTVDVARPRFWWRAEGARLRDWVNLRESPDTVDGYQRHDDRDEQRWDLIAEAVSAVGADLAAGAWTPLAWGDEQLPDGRVDLDLPTALTDTEADIVHSWFRDSRAVCSDPWNAWLGVTNGRHRIWGVLPYSDARLLPLRSTCLMYANPEDAGEYDSRPGGKRWQTTYLRALDDLYFTPWFDRDDALNRRFILALQEASRGQWPEPAAHGHDIPEPLIEPQVEPVRFPEPSFLERLLDWAVGADDLPLKRRRP